MLQNQRFLFHSRISFALNVKMLNPLEVIKSVEKAYLQGKVKINQAEGFIRQVLGWREFVRGIYWAEMPEYKTHNQFNHKNPLPDFFWTGNTDMNCLSQSIGQSLNDAYAHHIQRLMIIGNYALISGIDPDEVDRWYLGVYMDAFEWVELPNTRGMSQFADGGKLATKPYASSANYIQKMSNYCQHCKFNPKEKNGPNACPFNQKYWDFIGRNSESFRKNPRMSMMVKLWEKQNQNSLSS
jgi:deoxyribodipyrimidine photolyase-related protein